MELFRLFTFIHLFGHENCVYDDLAGYHFSPVLSTWEHNGRPHLEAHIGLDTAKQKHIAQLGIPRCWLALDQNSKHRTAVLYQCTPVDWSAVAAEAWEVCLKYEATENLQWEKHQFRRGCHYPWQFGNSTFVHGWWLCYLVLSGFLLM